MLLEVLEKVYGRTKGGKLSHHAMKFCEKHGFEMEKEYSITDLVVAFSTLSNKDKKELAIRMLMDNVNNGIVKDKRDTELLTIRRVSYKEACKRFHPDNNETGDEGIFKFIQDVKMSFWDCKGNPRKEIEHRDWERELYRIKNPLFKI